MSLLCVFNFISMSKEFAGNNVQSVESGPVSGGSRNNVVILTDVKQTCVN